MERRKRKSAPAATNRRADAGGSPGERFVGPLLQAAVLLLAALGFLFCLLTSYSLTVQTARLVWTALAFSTLFGVVLSTKRRWILLILCLLGAGLWVGRNADALAQGLLLLLEQALEPFNLRLPETLQAIAAPQAAQDAASLATLALQALLFPVALLAGCFVVCQPSVWGLAISTVPLLLPAFFYSLAPAVVPFFCLVAAHLMLYILSSGMNLPPTVEQPGREPTLACREEDLSAQRPAQRLLALFSLPLIVLTALLSCWMLPQSGYVRPEGIESLRQELTELDVGDLLLKSNDGLSHGNLRDLSAIRFSGEPALRVQVSEKLSLYLRGFAGALFTNDGWESVADADYARSAAGFSEIAPQKLHAAAAAAGTAQDGAYTLSVRSVAASTAVLWTPNGLVTGAEEIPGAAYAQDTALKAASSGVSAYALQALPCGATLSAIPNADGSAALLDASLAAAGSAMGLGDATGLEAQRVQSAARAYIAYVFDAYTVLPEETRLAAERLCAEYGLVLRSGAGIWDLFETCRAVRTLLTERCTYAYAPPEIPADADFASYFLQESRRGYCVHFATTATVLLRALGVPARYAEGYIVVQADYDKQADAEGYVDIEDTHAHAWVEVYDPVQLEWIPVEMTPSASADTASAPDGSETEPETAESATPEPTAAPTPEPAPGETPPAEQEPTTEPGTPSDPEPTQAAEGLSEQDAPGEAEPSATPETAGMEALLPGESPTSEPAGQAEAGADAPAAGDSAAPKPTAPLWPLLALALAGGLTLAGFGWRQAVRERRKRQFSQPDVNAAVLAVCQTVMAMLRFAGCAELRPLQTPEAYARSVAEQLPWLEGDRLQALLELAQRARFSGRACTERERDEAVAFARTLSAALAPCLPKLRRLRFCWRYPTF